MSWHEAHYVAGISWISGKDVRQYVLQARVRASSSVAKLRCHKGSVFFWIGGLVCFAFACHRHVEDADSSGLNFPFFLLVTSCSS